MHRSRTFIEGLLIAAALLVPLTAFAFGTSFGGRVLFEFPCLTPSGPGFFITILPAGLFPVSYIWAPGTVGLPPTHTGQEILGLADTPYGCSVGLAHFVSQRIQFDGVSL